MKKIIFTSGIIFSQIFVVGLFFLLSFNDNEKQEKVVVVENSNLTKVADSVSELFLTQTLADTKTEEVQEELVSTEEKEAEMATAAEEEKNEVVEEATTAPAVQIAPTVDTSGYTVYNTYYGTLTGYGPNCPGCSGYTASGYNVKQTTTYNDPTFGEVRIVAADSSIPLYSIIRINNAPNVGTVIAIVLDRGGNVGFGKGSTFDLLFSNETGAITTSHNIKFDLLREGR